MADDVLIAWAAHPRDGGDPHYPQRPEGVHPHDTGFPATEFKVRKLDRAPGEFDRVEGGKVRDCPIKRKAARFRRREMHHAMTRADVEDFVLAALGELLTARGLAPVTSAERAALFPTVSTEE